MSIIIFIIILAVLILVHEFGHFIVAKKSGIRVDEFGLGFPPKIYAKKLGDTLYTLNAIPFGGFVKIFGEDAHDTTISEQDKKTSFVYKPKWIQALVLVAGVTMNIVFAWLLISLGFVIGLPSPVDYAAPGQVKDVHLVVTEVMPGSPAEKAGLITGDTILFASSGQIGLQGDNLTPDNISHTISESGTKQIEIMYRRGSAPQQTLFITPSTTIIPGKKAIGIGTDTIGTLRLPVHKALWEGLKTTWVITKGTVIGLASFLWSIFRFKSDLSQVSGPIGIAGVVSQATNLGFVYLLSIIALISINLAVINLLPFPALDGGRLLFVFIEAILGRPISPKVVKWTNFIGFSLLVLLMVFVTGHDILKLL